MGQVTAREGLGVTPLVFAERVGVIPLRRTNRVGALLCGGAGERRAHPPAAPGFGLLRSDATEITGATKPAIPPQLALGHDIASGDFFAARAFAGEFVLFVEIAILLPQRRVGGLPAGGSTGKKVRDLPPRKIDSRLL